MSDIQIHERNGRFDVVVVSEVGESVSLVTLDSFDSHKEAQNWINELYEDDGVYDPSDAQNSQGEEFEVYYTSEEMEQEFNTYDNDDYY